MSKLNLEALDQEVNDVHLEADHHNSLINVILPPKKLERPLPLTTQHPIPHLLWQLEGAHHVVVAGALHDELPVVAVDHYKREMCQKLR